MNVIDAIKKRYSVRTYKQQTIQDDFFLELFEAARLAPSAMKHQPWRFVLVRSQDKIERIARGGIWARFASKAPAVIVACGDTRSNYYVHDTCIALEHMVLTATSVGLGTCWIVSFDEKDIREMLKIPDRYAVVALLSIGYPTKSRNAISSFLHFFRPTKKLREIAFIEKFGNPFLKTPKKKSGPSRI